jgi:hypothetical protein
VGGSVAKPRGVVLALGNHESFTVVEPRHRSSSSKITRIGLKHVPGVLGTFVLQIFDFAQGLELILHLSALLVGAIVSNVS